ncbi:MAG TPA: hypothetical protein VFZ53_30390 [Polyangiaceae bacterium]
MAIKGATEREPERFRIVHFSVQFDHLHLIVEAIDERALSAGIRSLAIRVARYVNALVMRKGRFWADRWHGRPLKSPREVRAALVYVFGNFRKHTRKRLGRGVDAYSSAVRFDGWREFQKGIDPPLVDAVSHRTLGADIVVTKSQTWLGAVGWRQRGLIDLDEAPSRTEQALGQQDRPSLGT